MSPLDDEPQTSDPTEQRGGAAAGDQEAQEKGPWAAKAQEGVVPPELGGSGGGGLASEAEGLLGGDGFGRQSQ